MPSRTARADHSQPSRAAKTLGRANLSGYVTHLKSTSVEDAQRGASSSAARGFTWPMSIELYRRNMNWRKEARERLEARRKVARHLGTSTTHLLHIYYTFTSKYPASAAARMHATSYVLCLMRRACRRAAKAAAAA